MYKVIFLFFLAFLSSYHWRKLQMVVLCWMMSPHSLRIFPVSRFRLLRESCLLFNLLFVLNFWSKIQQIFFSTKVLFLNIFCFVNVLPFLHPKPCSCDRAPSKTCVQLNVCYLITLHCSKFNFFLLHIFLTHILEKCEIFAPFLCNVAQANTKVLWRPVLILKNLSNV